MAHRPSGRYRAQADALEIEAAAKRRLADEYDAAQERGEARNNGERSFSGAEKVSAADIGLSGKDIHEARAIRDAEEADPALSGVGGRTVRNTSPDAAAQPGSLSRM